MPQRAPVGARPWRLAVWVVVLAVAWSVATQSAAGAATKCPSGPVTEGVDVSHYQGDIDWGKVGAAGKKFGYAKALEGVSFPDDKFAANYLGMKAAGIQPGAYLFFRPIVDPATQAYAFLEQLQKVGFGAGDLIPAIDVETTDGLPAATVDANLQTVIQIVSFGIGVQPVVYTTPAFWASIGSPHDTTLNPLWIAHWGVACPDIPLPPWDQWSFWQYSSTGSVDGITGPVDLDRFNGSTPPVYTSAGPHFYAKSPQTPAAVGTPYTYTFKATGSPKPTFAVTSGTLPPGLSLSAAGAVTGMPTTPGSYPFVVTATNTAGTDTTNATIDVQAAPPGARFHSMAPTRVLDSRSALGGWNGKLIATMNRSLKVTGGATGVPASASAIVVNVTVTGSNAGSFLTVYPQGTNQPNASNLNFGPGQTIPNLVTVKVGANGEVVFANAVGVTDVVADVVGYFDDGTGAGDLFNGVTPARILDSRTPNGGWNSTKLQSGDLGIRTLQVRGRGGVPSSATAVVMNVTVTGSTAGSFLTAWPSGTPRPNASSLNFGAGETIPNLVTVKLGGDGKVAFYGAVGATDVIADVVGYFDPTGGNRFFSLPTPTRVLDSRVNNGLSGRWAPGETRVLPITGMNGLPASAAGLIINTTVTAGTQGSFLTVFPDGAALPDSSNLNFAASQTIPNLVMVRMTNGKIDLYNKLGYVHVIADAVGYYAP